MQALRLRETDRWITANARRPSEPSCEVPPDERVDQLDRDTGDADGACAGADQAQRRWTESIEVYPAAALFVWDLPYRGYKGADPVNRRFATSSSAALRDCDAVALRQRCRLGRHRRERPCPRRALRVPRCACESVRALQRKVSARTATTRAAKDGSRSPLPQRTAAADVRPPAIVQIARACDPKYASSSI